MIGSDVAVMITFDEEGEKKIKAARETLEEILTAFSKAGGYTDGEENALREACHVLNEIERGDSF